MRILLTGLTREGLESVQDRGELGRSCYLCKRREGEESVVLSGEEGSEPELSFQPVEIDRLTWMMESEEAFEVVVPICTECQVILGLASDEDEEMEGGGFGDWE